MRAAKWLMGSALLATVLVYWVGLGGPFVLDDAYNLNPVFEWLRGDNTWRHALLQNTSGMLGRPISLATLMASAWLGGNDPYFFKLGNLFVHLWCALVGWQVLRIALARDQQLQNHADLTAAALTALWLLHPLNVSTVLYAVQRMAQVSTFFILAAVWAFLVARKALQGGETRRAALGLFAWFPLLVLAGLFSKENAAVAPALCLVLEIAYFRTGAKNTGARGDTHLLGVFYGVFLALPALFVAGLLLVHPERLIGGYSGRDFTLAERLLSEGRALADYIGALVLPRAPSMGVFTDGFAKSSGLLSPPSTLYALLFLSAITTLAIAVRKRAPSIFAGWFFFLVAHAIESSFLPLELYFEHRNYLPAFGLLLACAGTAELATRRVHAEALPRRKLGLVIAGAYAVALGFATLGRALVWADQGRLLTQEAKYHPNSVRANVALAQYAVHHDHADVAREAMETLIRNTDPRTRELGYLNRVLVDCMSAGSAIPTDLGDAVSLALPRVTLAEMYVFQDLASLDARRTCTSAAPGALADAIEALLASAHAQPDGERPKWRLRRTAADLRARSGEWGHALQQAKLAWQPTADAAVGGLLARAYAHNGLWPEAEQAYSEVADRIEPDNANDLEGLAQLRNYLDTAAAKAARKRQAPAG